jgi:hypothetical protein
VTGGGRLAAAAAGAVLLAAMFLNWYGLDVSGRAGQFTPGDAAVNAWQVFRFVDLVLVTAAVLGIGSLIARDAVPPVVLAGVAVLAAVLVLYRFVDLPQDSIEGFGFRVDVTREVGLYLGLLASIVLAFGAVSALRRT